MRWSVTQKKIRKPDACEFSFWQLREDDLNVQPSGYTLPCISARVDYLITPSWGVGRCGVYWFGSSLLVSAPFGLLARTTLAYHFIRLGSGLPPTLRCGFPEFTRFFAIRYRIVLQYRANLHESLRDSLRKQGYIFQVRFLPCPTSAYNLLRQSRTLYCFRDGMTTLQASCHIHRLRTCRLCIRQPVALTLFYAVKRRICFYIQGCKTSLAFP